MYKPPGLCAHTQEDFYCTAAMVGIELGL